MDLSWPCITSPCSPWYWGPAGKHPTLSLYLKGQSLDVIQGPWDRWRLAVQVGVTAADSPCAGMCFKAYSPVLTLTLLLPAMEVVSVSPQSSNTQLGIVSQLSCRALRSLFSVSLESTILLCCGTEIFLCSSKAAHLAAWSDMARFYCPPAPHTHWHTHTINPSKLLIKSGWLTFKCQHQSLFWAALTMINLSKKTKTPACGRWSLACEDSFLMLYHVFFGLKPLDSVPVVQVDGRTASAPSLRHQEWKSLFRKHREKSPQIVWDHGMTEK